MLIYIVYAVHQKVQNAKLEESKPNQNIEAVIENKIDPTVNHASKSLGHTEGDTADGLLRKNTHDGRHTAKKLKDLIEADSEKDERTVSTDERTLSWDFLSKQHWPELLTFYHIRFSERYHCYLLSNVTNCYWCCLKIATKRDFLFGDFINREL